MPTAPLSSSARATLRGRAQTLKALIHVGKEGLTPALVHAVSEALRTRDLVKLKVLETAPDDAKTFAATLAAEMEEVTVVQVMGRVVTLHRPLPARLTAPKAAAPKAKAAAAKPASRKPPAARS